MLSTIALPVLAYDTPASDASDAPSVIYLRYDGHGQYSKSNQQIRIATATVETAQVGDIITAKPTKDEEILHVSANQYITAVYADTYSLVDKVEIDTQQFDLNAPAFEHYDIPEDTILEIQEAIDREEQNGNSDFGISLYATTESNPYQHPLCGDNWFKDSIIDYRNSSIQPTSIVRHASTSTLTRDLFNFIVGVAGLGNFYVAIFGGGMSVLSYYESFKGPVVYGNQDDWLQVGFKYDRLVKKTYQQASEGWWNRGCTSQKLWINQAFVNQYYADNGEQLNETPFINRTFYTKSWDNAAYIAMMNWTIPVVDPSLTGQVATVTFVFS